MENPSFVDTLMIAGDLGGIRVGDRNPVRMMGVINLSENSFYTGSIASSDDAIKRAVLHLRDEGADIIDIGARSTAPYRASEVSTQTESRLLTRALKIVSKLVDVPISVDTTRLEAAKLSFEEGATILNDVFGFTQTDGGRLANLVASKDYSLITCAHEPRISKHADAVESVLSRLETSLEFGEDHGIDPRKITIDPGIGFFTDERISNVEWNVSILANLEKLRRLRRPICVGLSRKRFIGKLLGRDDPDDRLEGSLGATAVAVFNGAHLIRTHDVMQTRQAAKIAKAIREKGLSHQDEK
ncbi:MAG: dihydropteroate synthase [Nitrososphaerota archaeon]|nr:dihydropteroate synthase [Nitrososphaerota archaeon]